MDTMKNQDYVDDCFYFCGCLLDPQNQTLQSDKGVIRLRSKLWEVLLDLVNHPNKLVLRESLVRDIWHGNNYTGEQGLTHAICHLRSILKKHDINAKIITLPKKGYLLQMVTDNLRKESVAEKSREANNSPVYSDGLSGYSSNVNIQYIIR